VQILVERGEMSAEQDEAVACKPVSCCARLVGEVITTNARTGSP